MQNSWFISDKMETQQQRHPHTDLGRKVEECGVGQTLRSLVFLTVWALWFSLKNLSSDTKVAWVLF